MGPWIKRKYNRVRDEAIEKHFFIFVSVVCDAEERENDLIFFELSEVKRGEREREGFDIFLSQLPCLTFLGSVGISAYPLSSTTRF